MAGGTPASTAPAPCSTPRRISGEIEGPDRGVDLYSPEITREVFALFLVRCAGSLVVSDFGLCKIDASELTTVTKSGTSGGTFRYAAPEQWRNLKDADHRADVYSLGVVLQDLLVGSTSVEIGDADALTRVRADAFAAIVNRATAYRPEHRYADVGELRAAVKALAGTTTR